MVAAIWLRGDNTADDVRRLAALEAVFVPEPLEDPFARMPQLARRRTILLKNVIDDAGEGIELGASVRAAAPIARRRRKPRILDTISR